MRVLRETHVTVETAADPSLTDVEANPSEFELLAVLEHAARAWVHTKLLRPTGSQAY
jgi:hypothetical protein